MAEAVALRARPIAIKPLEATIVEVARPAQPVYPGAGVSTARLAEIARHAVSDAFQVEVLRLKGRRRGARRLAAAKQYAMALVHLVCGRSQEDVARAFARNRTTASHHMEMIEALNEAVKHEEFWNLLEYRFRLMVEIDALPCARQAWLGALHGLERSLDEGELEGDAVDQALYILQVFWEDRSGG